MRAGGTVAVVSPAFPAVARYPHRVGRGRAYLESLGLQVKLMPNAALDGGWAAGSGRERAADINAAFADDEVVAVLCALGGNHSNQILPHLDYALIRAHPKVFHGYSDVTVLQWALLAHAGLGSLYGPMLASSLAEAPRVSPYTDRWLRAAWFGEQPLEFEPASEWTDEIVDFDLDPPPRRELRPNPGWLTVREGTAEGPLLGGCLEIIAWHLKGSSAWLDLTGAVLFLETAGTAPTPDNVDSWLTDLEQLGVFDAVAGLVWGRPAGVGPEQVETLWDVVRARTEAAALPVLVNVDFGHSDPMLTLPQGANARLDAGAQTFEATEAAAGRPLDRPAAGARSGRLRLP